MSYLYPLLSLLITVIKWMAGITSAVTGSFHVNCSELYKIFQLRIPEKGTTHFPKHFSTRCVRFKGAMSRYWKNYLHCSLKGENVFLHPRFLGKSKETPCLFVQTVFCHPEYCWRRNQEPNIPISHRWPLANIPSEETSIMFTKKRGKEF